jgi:hypothetical protein
LLRKAFRDWAGTESEQKRIYIRNILSNAAAMIASDDVIKLFLDWVNDYSELHWALSRVSIAKPITTGSLSRKENRPLPHAGLSGR